MIEDQDLQAEMIAAVMNRLGEERNHLQVEVKGLRAERAAARAEVERLMKAVQWYEDGITWQTTCLNCAKLMNDNYDQYVKIDKANNRIAALEGAITKALHHASEGRRSVYWGINNWNIIYHITNILNDALRGDTHGGDDG